MSILPAYRFSGEVLRSAKLSPMFCMAAAGGGVCIMRMCVCVCMCVSANRRNAITRKCSQWEILDYVSSANGGLGTRSGSWHAGGSRAAPTFAAVPLIQGGTLASNLCVAVPRRMCETRERE